MVRGVAVGKENNMASSILKFKKEEKERGGRQSDNVGHRCKWVRE